MGYTTKRKELEIAKLEAEVAHLRRPTHKSITFWIIVGSFLLAALGTVGQNDSDRKWAA